MTTAKLFTAVGYNESTRSLHFKIECESLKDLKQCVSIIDSYNEFNSEVINNALDKYASRKTYYNENNPNNGKDLYNFHIGRENSPVIYVTLFVWEDKNKDNKKKFDFKDDMNKLAKESLANEFSIKRDGNTLIARLWWD